VISHGGDNDASGIVSGNATYYFGCFGIYETIHCDPAVTNKFESQKVPAEAKIIYHVTPRSMDTVPGKIGNAIPLKGYIGEYLTITNNAVVNPKTFSISFWMNQDRNFPLEGSMLSHIDFMKTSGWLFQSMPSPNSRVVFSVASASGNLFAVSATIKDSVFKNIVGTFDGNFVKLYVDGILRNITKFSGMYNPDPLEPLNFGLDSSDLGNAWKGILDDVRFFGKPLTDSEVRDIYNDKFRIPEPMLGYWPLDNNSKDMSGKGNDGLIVIQAVSMVFAPDGRMFFNEKNTGEIRIMKNDTVLNTPFVRLSDVHLGAHQGLLGITLDPDFQTKHYIYVYYTSKNNNTGNIYNKLVRFTDSKNGGIDEMVLLDGIPADPNGEFAGGALTFGPDDKLYVTVGDANKIDQAQNVSSLLGKILRINRDGTIPLDNPFPNSPIYTLGHRNMYGIAFDIKNKIGIVTENGEAHYDEINIIEKGSNYGFPLTQPPSKSPLIDNSSSIKPVRSYWHPIAPTQAIFYQGHKFPQFENKFLFGSYNEGNIYVMGIDQNRHITDETKIVFPQFHENIIALAESPTGDLYFGGYRIYKLTSMHTNEIEQLTHFIELSTNGPYVKDFTINSANKSISFVVISQQGVASTVSPQLRISIPKILINHIFQVSGNDLNHPGNPDIVKSFAIKSQFRTTNIGTIVVQIDLIPKAQGKVIVKGT